MDINEFIKHPEQLDRDTLYELRSLLALHPYFQTARLLLLQNLYLLHDPTFDEELRRAAIYITDRKIIFNLVEAAHYRITATNATADKKSSKEEKTDEGNRTISLIDTFLESIPKDEDSEDTKPSGEKKKRRRPTSADATVDYVAYLLENERSDEEDNEQPQMKGQSLIDEFIENDKGKIILNEIPEYFPQLGTNDSLDEKSADEGYFTETLARIYIKQHRYDRALEIIQRLSLIYPKKNIYFADQIRFLEKLIINNNKK